MYKKAQVLIICLWVLVVLTITVVSIGRMVSVGLKSAKAQRDLLKAICIAKTGLSRAAVEIENGAWQKKADELKKIKLEEDDLDYAVAKISDEQAKIDINLASQEQLTALFEDVNAPDAQGLANNIVIWRGDAPDTDKVYDNIGYPLKAKKISNIEELLLVKGMSEEYFNSIKDLVTVYGERNINLNTVSEKILKVLARSAAKARSISLGYADSISAKLIGLRTEDKPFISREDAAERVNFDTLSEDEKNLLNDLLDELKYTSYNFLIEVTGIAGKITAGLSAVYNINERKIIYWHEA